MNSLFLSVLHRNTHVYPHSHTHSHSLAHPNGMSRGLLWHCDSASLNVGSIPSPLHSAGVGHWGKEPISISLSDNDPGPVLSLLLNHCQPLMQLGASVESEGHTLQI